MKKGFCFLVFIFSTAFLFAQDSTMQFEKTDTLKNIAIPANDTASQPFKLKNIWSAEPHSPKKAALFSAVIPGLGQAYNRKYWKIPVLYAGVGIDIYAISFNAYYYNDLKNAYLIRTDGDSTTIDKYADILPSESYLLQYIDYYRKNLDISVIIGGAIYVLNIIDAIVDAQLYDFDVTDDLSLAVKPEFFPSFGNTNSNTFGFTIKLKLK